VCAWESAAHARCFVTLTKNFKVERGRRKGKSTGLEINSLSSRIVGEGKSDSKERRPCPDVSQL
jgi:hypothetical protein